MKAIFQNSLILLRASKLLMALTVLPAFVSTGLMFLPLFWDFDYEFNETLGMIVFLTAIGISITVERVLVSGIKDASEQIAIEIPSSNLYIFKYSLCIIFLHLLLPLIIVACFLFFCETCSLTRGFQFFLLLPVTGSIVGWSLGHLFATVFKRIAWVAVVCFLFLSLILNIVWLKFHVPIYVYSVFWGYFPGPLYDEWIPITATLWIHRLWSLCFALLFVVSALIWKQRPAVSRAYLLSFIVILSLIFVIYEMRLRIGFDTAYDGLKSELGGEIKSKHVSILFDRDLDSAEMNWIQAVSDCYYDQISRFLDLKTEQPVTIYIYKDEYQKKKLMGAGGTNFAKIINNEIHVNYNDVGGVLKHEMTHVLANEFGNRIYGTTRIGFLEGLAVAAEWNENYFTPHEWAAALKKQNKLPDVIPLIDGSGFFKNASGMSYIVSGSFARFLIDSFGVKLFKKAYYDEDVKTVYGMSKTELAERWIHFLDGVTIRDDDLQLAGLLIQPSVFQKKCPHHVADILEEAGGEYADENYLHASALYQKALYTDKENYRIVIAQIRSKFYGGELSSAVRSLDSLLTDEKLNYVSVAVLRVLKGDILLRLVNFDSAMIEYQQVDQKYKNIPYVYMSAKLRMYFLKQGLIDSLKELTGTLNTNKQELLLRNIINKNPDNWAAKFWLARLCFQRAAFSDVVTLIGNPNETMTDSIFALARLEMLADSYLRLKEYDLAQNSLEEANKWAVRSMDRELIMQRRSLLHWLVQRLN